MNQFYHTAEDDEERLKQILTQAQQQQYEELACKLDAISDFVAKLQSGYQKGISLTAMEEHHKRLQECLVETQIAMQHYGHGHMAKLLQRIAVSYCDHVALWRQQVLLTDSRQASTPQKRRRQYSQSDMLSTADHVTRKQSSSNRIGALGGSVIQEPLINSDFRVMLGQDPHWSSAASQKGFLHRLKGDGYSFTGLEMRDTLIKPIKYQQSIKILCHRGVVTDDIETRIRELMNMERLARLEPKSELSWAALRDKKEEIKAITHSSSYDELMRLIKWLNHRNGLNEEWLGAEMKYDNHLKDLDRMSVEELEVHLKENYTFIQQNSLQIMLKYFRRFKETIKQQRVTTYEKSEKEKPVLGNDKVQNRKLADKVFKLQSKLKLYKRELSEKDKDLEKYIQLSSQFHLQVNQQNHLLEEFRRVMGRQKTVKPDSKVGNDSQVSYEADRSLIENMQRQLEEINNDNMKLSEQVTELNEIIDRQRVDFHSKLYLLKSRRQSTSSLVRQATMQGQVINTQPSESASADLIRISIRQVEDRIEGKVVREKQTQTSRPQLIDEANQRSAQNLLQADQQEQTEQQDGSQEQEGGSQVVAAHIEILSTKDQSIQTLLTGRVSISSELLDKQLQRQQIKIQDNYRKLNTQQSKMAELESISSRVEYKQRTMTSEAIACVSTGTQTELRLLFHAFQQLIQTKQIDITNLMPRSSSQEQQSRLDTKPSKGMKTEPQQIEPVLDPILVAQIQQLQGSKAGTSALNHIQQLQASAETYLHNPYQFKVAVEPPASNRSNMPGRLSKIRTLTQNIVQMQNIKQQDVLNNGEIVLLSKRNSITGPLGGQQQPLAEGEQQRQLPISEFTDTFQKRQEQVYLQHVQSQHQLDSVVIADGVIPPIHTDRTQRDPREGRDLQGGRDPQDGRDPQSGRQGGHTKNDRVPQIRGTRSLEPKHPRKIQQHAHTLNQLLMDALQITHYENIVPQQFHPKPAEVVSGQQLPFITRKHSPMSPKEGGTNLKAKSPKAKSPTRLLNLEIAEADTIDEHTITTTPVIRRIFEGITRSDQQLERSIRQFLNHEGSWDFDVFRMVFKLLVKQHKLCGLNCIHLQRFYARYGLLPKLPKNRVQLHPQLQQPKPF